MYKSKILCVLFLSFLLLFSGFFSFSFAFTTGHLGAIIKTSELPFPILLVISKNNTRTDLLVMSKRHEINSLLQNTLLTCPAFNNNHDFIYYIKKEADNAEIWRVAFNKNNLSLFNSSIPQQVTFLKKFISDFSISGDDKKIFFSASDSDDGYSRSSLYSKKIDISKKLNLVSSIKILKSEKEKKNQNADTPFFRYSSPVYNELSDSVFYTRAEIPFKNAKSFSALSIWKLRDNKTEKMIGGFSGFDAQGNSQGFMACRPMNWHSNFAFIKTIGKIDSSLALYSPEKAIEIYRPDAMLIRPILQNPWLVFGEKKENKTTWFMINLDSRQKFAIDLPDNTIELGL